MTDIKYGDTVLIAFPNTSQGQKIVTGIGPPQSGGSVHIIANSATVLEADPYVIDPIPNSGNQNGSSLKNGSIVRLRRLNDTGYRVWYNKHEDNYVQLASASFGDGRSQWTLSSTTSSTGNIKYGQSVFVINGVNSQNATFDSTANATLGNISDRNSNETSDSNIIFLPGDPSTAKLECCKDNPIFTQPDFCGTFRGTKCTGQCDTILTDYCAKVTTSDPRCGCLLPKTFYEISSMYGPAACIDDRCVNRPNMYRASTQCNPICDITNCVISLNDLNNTNAHINKIALQQECGQKSSSTTNKIRNFFTNPVFYISSGIVLLLIIIIIIIIAYVIIKKRKNKTY